MADINNIRSMFPQLDETVYGKHLVYLDNAATALRPLSVIDKWLDISSHKNANLHRAVHHIAAVATEQYENARASVAQFIGAGSPSEIIFTSGTTNGINLLAFSFGEIFISEGDEIIVTESEHHSNIVPWQMLCMRKHAVLKVLPVDDEGYLRVDLLPDLITDRTKIACVTHVSNVLGIINPVKEIVNICHSKNCKVLIDGAQGSVHCKVNVTDMDCDFYVFSGHKLYASPSTGVLYGKKALLDVMPPYMGGGEMIANVKWSGTTYAPVPYKFEAGTQNISGTPTLIEAIKMVEMLREPEVEAENQRVVSYILEEFGKRPHIHLYGVPRRTSDKISLFSFTVDGAHHEDLALILDKMGVAVRSGQMCAEPLMDRFGVTGMLRASFAPYNTLEEAECFIKCLDRAIEMLK